MVNKRVRLRTKVQLYKCYVLPILRFGSEFWALTRQQTHRLEVVHNKCMREIMHVMRLVDRVCLAQASCVSGVGCPVWSRC